MTHDELKAAVDRVGEYPGAVPSSDDVTVLLALAREAIAAREWLPTFLAMLDASKKGRLTMRHEAEQMAATVKWIEALAATGALPGEATRKDEVTHGR